MRIESSIDIRSFSDQNLSKGGYPAKLKTRLCSLSFWRCITILFSLVIIVCLLIVCKAYIKIVLLWLESQDPVIISITIVFLFIIVALPVSIGYIVLVVACGYLFGILRGMLLTVIGANFGLFVAHNILKIVGHYESVYKFTHNQTAQAIMRVISGPLCFKIVFCSRLTPIPFGLQNIIFALSNVSARVYHVASLLGLFPAQFVGVYVGTTLRSMHDVLENNHISSTTYFFISVQLIFGASLIAWLGAKARKELLKALSEAETVPFVGNSFSSIV